MSVTPLTNTTPLADAVAAAPEVAERRAPSLALHDAERSARLDHLFDLQFSIPRRPSLRVTINHALKRGLDIVVALVGLALTWPVMLIAGVATLLDTGRPVFYSQVRRIRFGRRVRVHKMRTLVVGADRSLGALVDIKTNGRYLNIQKSAGSYTRVGRWLERLWIVELPQLWSVLRGHMSLVGNRPLPDYVIEALGETPEVIERFASPQGLTGYTQVIGRDNLSDHERICLECHYSQVFEHGNVFLEDLRIVGVTLLTYLGLGRRRTVRDFLPANFHLPTEHRVPLPIASEGDCRAVQRDHARTLAVLACPTCYVVKDACDSTKCRQECVSACKHDALTMGADGRPRFLDACIACSDCVAACPFGAIDKHALRPSAGGMTCDHCGTEYPEADGVLDLLPRRANLPKSPYFEFYDHEYVGDNPQMHLEDTDWKLRELRPLLDAPGSYRSLVDIGCGAGELGRRIAAEFRIPHAVSSEWSSQILSVARQREPHGTYIRTDAAYLPYRNRSFDLALLIDVIEHQHQPEQVLREAARISDALLLRTPLEDCWYERLRRRRKDLFRESSGHVVHFDLGSVRVRLQGNGWRVLRDSVRHIAWSHWKNVLGGAAPLSGKLTAAARFALRFVLPKSLYRRLFVTNYNALCASRNGASEPRPLGSGDRGAVM